MDKLRAIQYFNHAVEHGSFAATARLLDVSTPAVTQLVAALERSLGVVLLHRSPQGLSLTADGEQYYETSRKIVADLQEAERHFGTRGGKPSGSLTVGVRGQLGHTCVMPHITKFLNRYPDVDLTFKSIVTYHDIDDRNVDVALLVGWPPERNLVVRQLVQTQLMVFASPEYLSRAGIPQTPEDLAHHHCLLQRSSSGALLDRWIFEKNGERRTVDVKTPLVSDDRTFIDIAACYGAGLIRIPDLVFPHYLPPGMLVPVLSDWKCLESPVIYVAYPPSQRRSKLVRAFVEFMVDVFSELERTRTLQQGSKVLAVPKPVWYGRALGRQSVYEMRNKK